jgi:IS5 family transposase
MKLYEQNELEFIKPLWAAKPELGLMDAALEKHPELIETVVGDVTEGAKDNGMGRQDTPSVEQIVRAAIYKEIFGLDYRGLEFAQFDSRLFGHFVKVRPEMAYSFQVYQKYISRIKEPTLEKIMITLNKIAIDDGIEDISRFVQDSTVTKSDIHYPTDSSLIWDCIHKSQSLLEQLKEEVGKLEIKDYSKAAKHDYFWLSNTRKATKREKLMLNQLKRLVLAIDQVTKVVKKKCDYGVTARAIGLLVELEELVPVMEKVYRQAVCVEILGIQIPAQQKIVSIFEQHTDIIVKGQREVQFGHKVNLGTGKSNLILTCEIEKGNPADNTLYKRAIEKVKKDYAKTPESSVTDGGYASLDNLNWSKEQGITNIVFNKIRGSLQSVATNKRIENKLKRWRSSIEAVISNLKRGFNIRRCTWKGWEHFKQKVLWSVIAYNIRVMTAAYMLKLANL